MNGFLNKLKSQKIARNRLKITWNRFVNPKNFTQWIMNNAPVWPRTSGNFHASTRSGEKVELTVPTWFNEFFVLKVTIVSLMKCNLSVLKFCREENVDVSNLATRLCFRYAKTCYMLRKYILKYVSRVWCAVQNRLDLRLVGGWIGYRLHKRCENVSDSVLLSYQVQTVIMHVYTRMRKQRYPVVITILFYLTN